MRFTFSAAVLASVLAAVTLGPSSVEADLSKMPASAALAARAGGAPDVVNIKVTNLTPEDGVYDVSRHLIYQSNLWKGRISAWDPRSATGNQFNVLIPGVSSTGYGSQQMAGLSLNVRKGATALFAVAKASSAFNFALPQSRNTDPCSFHKFNLPVTSSSTPAWSVYMNNVQTQFQTLSGIRPFGNVASAQDAQGNSYVIFALGVPAIAKISADGKTVTPWFWEASNGSQRPGYSGITYIPESNSLMAFGGPRPLTLFRLSNSAPTAIPVTINGDFGTLTGTEKIKTVPSNDNTGSRLFGVKEPYVYSFKTSNDWAAVTFKRYTRSEFKDGLTTVVEIVYGGLRNAYASSAYFSNGPKGGKTTYPLYKIPDSALLA